MSRESRLELHQILIDILGSKNVYFQPPESIKIKYPCIIYNRNDIDTRFADNIPYKISNEYSITSIEKDPDSDLPLKIAQLPQCSFERSYTSDNLHHNVFNMIYK